MAGGARALREFLDASSFTDNYTKWELQQKTISNALAWDVYGGRTEFTAKVLSPPINLSNADAECATGTASNREEGQARRPAISNKFAFKARILGNPSPHDFLSDPCELSTADDDQSAYRLISLHTTFLSGDDPSVEATSIPKVGDIVNIELEADQFSYNLQFGKFIGIATNVSAGMESVPGGDNLSERLAQQAREDGAEDMPAQPTSCFHLLDLFLDFDSSLFAEGGLTLSIDQGSGMTSTGASSSTGNAITDLEQEIVTQTARSTDLIYGTPQGIVEATLAMPYPSYTHDVTSFVQAEISFWAGKTETHGDVYERLNQYWTNVGWTEDRWTPAGVPWSAAYISWVQSQSGRTDARSTWPKSAAHRSYAESAWDNRKEGNSGWAAFSLLHDNVFFDVGDVVIKPRDGSWGNTHGDVVYKIEDNVAYLSGGNVGHTAKQVGTIALNTVSVEGSSRERANFPNLESPKAASIGPYVVILKYMKESTMVRASWRDRSFQFMGFQ